ncbi:hypothetical protein [Methanosarcina sp.]|jgi:hypothetical protein|uniref:hypothetical protein n=1 Tax=Methanosarcina sp. TaxID=2213 RepID=UPI002BA833EE|nr:hypothetical protein [Methanosarcina sp.]HOW15623.1 hypothetical protein [Methanosarcina sp.]
MSIYVDQRRFTDKSSIKINSISGNYDHKNPVKSSPVKNNFHQDNPVQSTKIQDNSLSLHRSFPSSPSASPASGQDSDLKVFLDMDGVLTDFTGACEKLSEHMMIWYAADRERFWKHITAAGPGFWSEMPWMTGGKELHGFLKSSGLYPTILSALPSPDRKIAMANARKGKIEWLKKELGDPYANDAILCFRPEKALQSGSSRILIDDNSNNIREWEEAGGTAILHKSADRTIRCLCKIVKEEQKA